MSHLTDKELCLGEVHLCRNWTFSPPPVTTRSKKSAFCYIVNNALQIVRLCALLFSERSRGIHTPSPFTLPFFCKCCWTLDLLTMVSQAYPILPISFGIGLSPLNSLGYHHLVLQNNLLIFCPLYFVQFLVHICVESYSDLIKLQTFSFRLRRKFLFIYISYFSVYY